MGAPKHLVWNVPGRVSKLYEEVKGAPGVLGHHWPCCYCWSVAWEKQGFACTAAHVLKGQAGESCQPLCSKTNLEGGRRPQVFLFFHYLCVTVWQEVLPERGEDTGNYRWFKELRMGSGKRGREERQGEGSCLFWETFFDSYTVRLLESGFHILL